MKEKKVNRVLLYLLGFLCGHSAVVGMHPFMVPMLAAVYSIRQSTFGLFAAMLFGGAVMYGIGGWNAGSFFQMGPYVMGEQQLPVTYFLLKYSLILIGVLVSYAVALVTGAVDFAAIGEASWIGFPIHKEAMGLFAIDGSEKFISALFTIMPIAIATMMEHIGDIAAISATTGRNYIRDPGLNRTLMGDGLATAMAGLLGGPANTTYGENTGVLALTKIYDPLVIRIAAVFACILSFCPKFEAIINTIPSGIIGGISFVLYGMISAIGVRNVVENQVDFTNSRNLIIAAVILVCALGFNSVGGITFGIGGVSVTLSGLAIAALAGILLNAILPGNDYEFDSNPGTGEGTSLRV